MNQVSTNDPEPYQQPITLHSQHDVYNLVENDLIYDAPKPRVR